MYKTLLTQLLVNNTTGYSRTSARLTDLNEHMKSLLKTQLFRGFMKSNASNALKDAVEVKVRRIRKDIYTYKTDVRLATYDLSMLTKGVLRPLQASQGSELPNHAAKAGHGNPPVWYGGGSNLKSIERVTERYLLALAKYDMSDHAWVANTICQYDARYMPIISLDYYTDRKASRVAFHKDTTGNTLFVGLHYLNPSEMLGPEYVYDNVPCKAWSKYHGHSVTSPYWSGKHSTSMRTAAPWSVSPSGTGYWPRQLLADLERARAENGISDTAHNLIMQPYGLVTFVDELIYHSTPYDQHRGKYTRKYDQPTSATSNDIFPKELKRQISFRIDAKETLPTIYGGMKSRSFVRVWISIVPKSWFETAK